MGKIHNYTSFIKEAAFVNNVTLGFYQVPINVTKELLTIIYLDIDDSIKVKKVNKFLRDNKGNLVYLYHGTSSDVNLEDDGLLTTKKSTKKSIQSEVGYVYLSAYEDSAKTFGRIGSPFTDTKVVKIEIAISNLKPDKDQLFNKRRAIGNLVGITLGDSLVYGSGFRVKGNIPNYMIKDTKLSKRS